jgi:hypothetical protein
MGRDHSQRRAARTAASGSTIAGFHEELKNNSCLCRFAQLWTDPP